jgi:hypothetical protein
MLLVLAATLAARPAPAAPTPYVGAQYRYWAFTNHNDLRDVLAYWVPGPFHVQLEYWDFVDPATRDQFRPEVGLHLRDRRRSVYTVQWRHELDDERLTLGTDQVLSSHLVGRAEVSPLIGRDSTQWVFDGGGDWYWGSYNFASATLIHDPRGGGLWVVPLRARLANESNDWLQFTIAPASRRTLGWAAEARVKGVRLGVERNSRFDFTNLDNVIYTIGFERTLGPGP